MNKKRLIAAIGQDPSYGFHMLNRLSEQTLGPSLVIDINQLVQDDITYRHGVENCSETVLRKYVYTTREMYGTAIWGMKAAHIAQLGYYNYNNVFINGISNNAELDHLVQSRLFGDITLIFVGEIPFPLGAIRRAYCESGWIKTAWITEIQSESINLKMLDQGWYETYQEITRRVDV